MSIPWEKFLISAVVGFGLLSLLKPRGYGFRSDNTPFTMLPPGYNECPHGTHPGCVKDDGYSIDIDKGIRPVTMPCAVNGNCGQAYQANFFGFSGPQIGLSADVQTPNCTPANMTGNGLARYCNPPGVECASGVDCADARAQYCRKYAPGGVCLNQYGAPAADQGLPGQGPVVGSGLGDIANAFGFNPYTQQYGSASPAGYGYNPYPVPQYPTYGYGYSQPSYGYPQYPTYGYSYNPYQYRRAYAVTGYDKRSGHFLYG